MQQVTLDSLHLLLTACLLAMPDRLSVQTESLSQTQKCYPAFCVCFQMPRLLLAELC